MAHFRRVIGIFAILLLAVPLSAERPNVLLIVADDMGYTDLGSFGGEISTPRLDALASAGVRLTNLHAAPSCSPTRAMLMSGCDNHVAGLGAMNEQIKDSQKDQPGYETYLNDQVAALPELLQDAGYHTYMAGKWHLGLEEEQSPKARGFEHSVALLVGGASHFDISGTEASTRVAPYREDGEKLESLPEDFYSTEFYADKMMEYIEAGRGDGKPFFGWLAFTAPHWPLHAPDEFIEKSKGKYDAGYDAIREGRLERGKSLGLVPEGYDNQSFHRVGRDWSQLGAEQQKISARTMEVYSAMIECMDFHIGRVLDYLKKTGQLENTYVIFMSDNGSDGGDVTAPQLPFAEYIAEHCDNSYENLGRDKSFVSKGRDWAQACTAPYKLWKGFTTEGGIRVPGIIYSPGMKRKGAIDDQLLSAMDVAPTVLELAGAKHPGSLYKERAVAPIQGKSFASLFDAEAEVHSSAEPIGWELHGRRALFMGDLKAVHYGRPHGSGQWEVFDLKNDPGEVRNLAISDPSLAERMAAAWDQYAASNGVVAVQDVPGGPGGGQGGRKGGQGRQGGQGGQRRGPQGMADGGRGQRPQGMQGGQRPQGGGQGGQRQPLIGALDANFDMQISEEEMRNAPAAILALDVNRDGQLTQEEYGRADRNRQGGQAGPSSAASPSSAVRAPVAEGKKIYVKSGGAGNGSSWDEAAGDLVAAMRAAAPGDEIRVAQGTYFPSASGDRSASFQLPRGVTVLGGFSGAGEQRDWTAFTTVLSGDIGERGSNLDNSYHIVLGAEGAVLDGFTISGGNGINARGGGGGGQGPGAGGQRGPGAGGQRGPGAGGQRGPGAGGQRGPGAGGQRGPGAGGQRGPGAGGQRGPGAGGQRGPGAGGQRGGPGAGGGRGPGAGGPGAGGPGAGGPGAGGPGAGGPGAGGPGAGGPGAGGQGGPGAGGPGGEGNAPIHITPQMILRGANPGAGAGIVNFQCAPTYRNCIIRDNSSRKGAGAYNMTSITSPADPEFAIQPAPEFINCSFINNYAIGRGGAISNDLGTEPIFIQCSFIDNKCDGKGGAIYNDFRCSPTLISCLFTGNSAYDGGALGNDGSSSPIITNCTFTKNHAIDMGAALYQGSGPSNNPVVTNTIIWGNTCENGPAGIVNWHDNSPVVTYSCIEGGYPGEGNVSLDPRFVDPDNDDYSLADGSPCADAANGLAGPSTDRVGAERYDDTGLPNGAVASTIAAMGDLGRTARQGTAPADIGAFERQKSSPTEKLPTVFVNVANQGTQGLDGRSWDTAFATIQPAIELAYRSSAEVWIAGGTYVPTDDTDRTKSIRLRDGVALFGGFSGEESSKDQRDIRAHVTTLSGNIGRADLSEDNSYHVLVGAKDASIDGFVVSGGNANGEAFHAKGGGMINYARHIQKAPTGWATGFTVKVTNTAFVKNTAIEGGAVYNYDRSEPVFSNVVFQDNTAESGGAIVDRVGVLSSMTRCQFINNYAKWRGGAVYFDYGSRPDIQGCQFKGNRTDGHGGAAYIISRASQLENSVMTVADSVFDGNSARLRGGAIANADSGVLVASSSQFTGNRAGRGGGAISNEYLSRATVKSLQFTGNESAAGEADIDTDESSKLQIQD